MSQVILCGLIGIPPSNGVIPQSPMHTKSLATLKHQVYIYTFKGKSGKIMHNDYLYGGDSYCSYLETSL
jgi:hypothetical protein